MCVCVFVFNSWTQPWPTWVCLQIDPRKSEEMTILRGSKERTLQPARFTWFQRWEIYIESSALSGSHHLGNKKSRSDVRQDIIKCQKSLTKCGNGVSWSTCKTRKLLTLTELSKIRAKVLKLPTWYIIICSANLAQPHAPPNPVARLLSHSGYKTSSSQQLHHGCSSPTRLHLSTQEPHDKRAKG